MVALLLGAVRGEDFFDGGILHIFLHNGSLMRWILRLKELDDIEDEK